MKTISTLIVFVLFFFIAPLKIHGQFVYIPDSTFRNFISSNIDPMAIVGDSLDTTNVNVINRRSIQIWNQWNSTVLRNYEGIQYFDSLLYFKINEGNVTGFSNLPPVIVTLNFEYCHVFGTIDSSAISLRNFTLYESSWDNFNSLPDSVEIIELSNFDGEIHQLPDALIEFHMRSNQSTFLLALPSTIDFIEISSCNITGIAGALTSLTNIQIDNCTNIDSINLSMSQAEYITITNCNLDTILLPQTVTFLNLSGNKFASFQNTPASVIYLILGRNLLDTVANLPPALAYLNISQNNFKYLHNLPLSLKSLDISSNPFIEMPQWPVGLTHLYCKVTMPCLSKLPDSLMVIDYDFCLPNKPPNITIATVCPLPIHYYSIADSAGNCMDSLVANPDIVSITWGNGDTSLSQYNVCPGVFSAIAVSSDGCYYERSMALGDSGATVTPQLYNTCGSYWSTIILEPQGGSPPYTFINLATNDTIDVINEYNPVYTGEGLDGNLQLIDGTGTSYDFNLNYPASGEPGYVVIGDALCPGFENGYYFSVGFMGSSNDCSLSAFDLDTGTYLGLCYYNYDCVDSNYITIDYMYQDYDSIIIPVIKNADCGKSNGAVSCYCNYIYEPTGQFNFNIIYANNQVYTDSTLTPGVYALASSIDGGYGVWNVDVENYATVNYSEGCTPIFPGDANNDGFATNIDLLNIGLSYGDTGFVRADTTISWDAKYAQDWQNVFTDNLNHKFADCNGDGVVNDADTLAVITNYGNVHLRQSATGVANTSIQLSVVAADSIDNAHYQEALITLDTLSGNNDSIYGVAFTVFYDPLKIDENSIIFEPDSEMFGEAFLKIQKITDYGAVSFAVTSIDHLNHPAQGLMGKFRYRINNRQTAPSWTALSIQVDGANQADGSILLLDGATDSIYIAGCIDDSLKVSISISGSPHCQGSQWLCSGKVVARVTGGTTPFSYDWTGSTFPANNSINNDTVGGLCSINQDYFIVIVTDSNGCTASYEREENNPHTCYNIIYHSQEEVSCPGANDGEICVSTSPFTQCATTFYWSNGEVGNCVNNLSAGNYTCYLTVVRDFLCTIDTLSAEIYSISEPALPFNVMTTYPDCGQCNGEIVFNQNSNVVFDLSYNFNLLAGYSLNSVCADSSYMFNVYFDGNGDGCYVDTIVHINQCITPCTLNVTAFTTNSCISGCNASVILETNSTDTLQYDWSQSVFSTLICTPQLTGDALTGLPTGTYKCIVSNQTGCVDSVTVNVYSDPPSFATLNSLPQTCSNDCNGYIQVSADPFYMPLSVLWNNGDTLQELNNSCSGNYICYVSSVNGCVDTLSAFISLEVPDFIYEDFELPLCPGVYDGHWRARTSLTSFPYISAENCSLDTGYFEYTYTLSANCDFIYPVSQFDHYIYPSIDSILSFSVDTPDCGLNNGALNFNVNSTTGPLLSRIIQHEIRDSIDLVTSIGLNSNYYIYTSVQYQSYCNYPDILLSIDTIFMNKTGCTVIFPGDANDDGVADNTDLLNIGIAYDDTGSVRADSTTSWNGKLVQDWSQSFINNVNHKHADSNGDGVVNDADTLAIVTNYGSVHLRQSAPGVTNSSIQLSIVNADSIGNALYQEALIVLDTLAGNSDSIYGLAFTLFYDPIYIDANSIVIEPLSDLFNVNKLTLQNSSSGDVSLNYAATFTDHINRSASGSICRLKYKINSSIPSEAWTSFIIQTDAAMKADGSEVLVNEAIDSFYIAGCVQGNINVDLFVADYPYCNNGSWNCNGQVIASVSGGLAPYNYDWTGSSFPVTTSINNDTVAGLCSIRQDYFTVIVTDSNGCTAFNELDNNDPIICNSIIYHTQHNVSCPGANDGIIQVGSSVFNTCQPTYYWSNGTIGNEANNLAPGNYIVYFTIVQEYSCIVDTVTVQYFTITEPPIPFTIQLTQPACGECNGKIEFVQNGSEPIYPVYNSLLLVNNILDTVCQDTSYQVYVYYDGNSSGCVADTSILLDQCITPPCTLEVNASSFSSCSSECGATIILTSNTTEPLQYDWSQSIYDTSMCHILNNSLFQDSISTGYYKLIVTDSVGCRDSIETSIYSGNVDVNLITEESCYNFCGGWINASAAGGIQPYHYNWGEITLFLGDCTEPVFTDDSSANNLHSGYYYCIVTDSMGCSDSAVVNVNTANMDGIITYSYPQTCANDCNGGMELWHFVMNVSTPSILWSNGSTNFSTYGVCEGTYTYTLNWGLTCVDTGSVIIVGTDSVYLSYVTMIPTCDSCNGAINLNASGGAPPYDIYFDQQFYVANNDTVFNVCATQYIILIEDSLNCIYQYEITVSCDSIVTGIENYSKEQIAIFPNPNNGTFKISGLDDSIEEIEISNSIGEIVFVKRKVSTSEVEINAELKPGVYLCRVKSDDKDLQVKIVIY